MPSARYSLTATRSCSASEAFAGSVPLPPLAFHVDLRNWYLPRYVPFDEMAFGSPPDSHRAIRLRMVGTLTEPAPDPPPPLLRLRGWRTSLDLKARRPSARRVWGPTTPSTVR